MKYFTLPFVLIAALTGTMAYHFESAAHTITPDVKSCLNLRQSPNGRRITCVRSGEHLDVIRTSGNWIQVRHGGKVGWVYGYNNRYIDKVETTPTAVTETPTPVSISLSTDTVPQDQAAQSSQTAEAPTLQTVPSTRNQPDAVIAEAIERDLEVSTNQMLSPAVGRSSCLRLRSGPSTDTNAQACMPSTTRMRATGEQNGDWVRVETDKGLGWVRNDLIEAASFSSGASSSSAGAEMWRTNTNGRSVRCSRSDTNPVKCMACNAHFEAGNQSEKGRQAVHYVVFNRVQAPAWPNDICKVIWQNRQFSWTQDRKSDTMPARTFERMQNEAIDSLNEFLVGELDSSNIAACSEHYVNPRLASRSSRSWRRRLTTIGRIGAHEFYRRPNHRCFDGTGAGYETLARAAGVPSDSGRLTASLRPMPRPSTEPTAGVQ